MPKPFRCACCNGQLEPAQQLRFLVELDNLDNPAYLAGIRVMPSVNGKPVPVCKACQALLEAAPRPVAKPKRKAKSNVVPLALTAGVFGAFGVFGALSVGVILSSLMNSRG